MRVRVLTVGFLLTSALISITSLAAIRPAEAHTSKVTCICEDKAKPVQRKAARKVVRRMAARPAMRRGGYYDYGSAGAYRGEWHGEWRVAPAMAPAAYGPPPGAYYEERAEAYGPPPGAYDEAGMQIDRGGWSGGVGGDPEGGGGGGGGFGQIHLGQGGNQENGPTYNSYNQSFQFNPSVAGPFQPRLMGGFAPRK